MSTPQTLYISLTADLTTAGAASAYPADANEPDPRYKSYGVRMPEVKAILKTHRAAIRALSLDEKIKLAYRLIASGYGEQQTIGFSILKPIASYFTPDKFDEIDELMSHVCGWSKVDTACAWLLQSVLGNHPDEMVALARRWNRDSEMWLRRTSVVLFTRKVAESGKYNDVALEFCENLKFDPEDLVRKGVGWCLKDLMRSDKPRIVDYVKQAHADGVSGTITRYALRDLPKEERHAILM